MSYFTLELQKSENSIRKCIHKNMVFYQLCLCLSVHPSMVCSVVMAVYLEGSTNDWSI